VVIVGHSLAATQKAVQSRGKTQSGFFSRFRVGRKKGGGK